MASWGVFALVVVAVMLFRRQGAPWPAVIAKLAGLVALSMLATVLVAVLVAGLS